MKLPTILLVEDEALLREGLQEILEVHGFKVIGAADGAEALEWMTEAPVDLVITDLIMPNMNGIEFVEVVSQKFPSIPVIVVSGSPGAVMARLGIESISLPGTAASITKPFKAKEIVALIQKVLN